MKYILSIDQGTTGTTAVLVNSKSFEFVGKKNMEFKQILPAPGMVEHDLNEIWQTVKETTQALLKDKSISARDIECIGITNQRETTCAFSKKGIPLHNAIVWQDRRTSKMCEGFKSRESLIKKKTGLPIDPYFSGTKIKWLLENSQDVKEACKKEDLLFGTIDTYLLYKLTDGSSFYTDPTNASRTLLMDLQTCSWDKDLLSIFNISEKILPIIKDSFSSLGKTEGLDFLPDGIPITGILGDQQAALFGQAGVDKGSMKCTYGTGSFILFNTGEQIIESNSGLLTTVAYKSKEKTLYALEGSCYITGAAVQWLRDNLKIISEASEIEALANEVENIEDMKNIFLFPFFTGIGSPYWKAEATASIIGLTRDSSAKHIARACLEGIAFSINDLINSMKKDTGLKIPSLNVDGGAVVNELLMTMQATISKLKIIRPEIIETTAYGAALGAAVGHKLISIGEINKLWKKDKEFIQSEKMLSFYEEKSIKWKKLIEKIYL